MVTQCSSLCHMQQIMAPVPYRPMMLQYYEVLSYYWLSKLKHQFIAHWRQWFYSPCLDYATMKHTPIKIGGELIKFYLVRWSFGLFQVSSWPIFLKVWESFIIENRFKKLVISILIANDDVNTTPETRRVITTPSLHLRDCIFWACTHTGA